MSRGPSSRLTLRCFPLVIDPMPIWLHLLSSTLCQFAAAIAAPMAVMYNLDPILDTGMPFKMAIFGSFILAILGVNLLFKYVVPAACPECGGRTIPRGSRPISYHCRDCGFIRRTWVRMGK